MMRLKILIGNGMPSLIQAGEHDDALSHGLAYPWVSRVFRSANSIMLKLGPMENLPDEDIVATLFDIKGVERAAMAELHEGLTEARKSMHSDRKVPDSRRAAREIELITKQIQHWSTMRELVSSLPLQLAPDSILQRVDDSPSASRE
jgi:hypothetical protein